MNCRSEVSGKKEENSKHTVKWHSITFGFYRINLVFVVVVVVLLDCWFLRAQSITTFAMLFVCDFAAE